MIPNVGTPRADSRPNLPGKSPSLLAANGISLDDERIAGVRTVSDFKNLIALKIAEVA